MHTRRALLAIAATAAAASAASCHADATPLARHGIAHEILDAETTIGPTPPAMHDLLDRITAMSRERLAHDAELAAATTPRARALRSFAILFGVLTDLHFVYPGRGYVDLLREGLADTLVDNVRRGELLRRDDNGLRVSAIEGNASGVFHIADCDLDSVIFANVGEELDLPIHVVELPGYGSDGYGHAFVTWPLPDGGAVSWEADTGMEHPLIFEASHFAPPPSPLDQAHAIATRSYDVPLAHDEVLGMWHETIATALISRGEYATARDELRAAIRLAPERPSSYQRAAWLASDSSDPAVRDPEAALAYAERYQAMWPGLEGADTLAIAQAAAGQWPAALANEERALALAGSDDLDLAAIKKTRDRMALCQPYTSPRPPEEEADAWAHRVATYGYKPAERIEPTDLFGNALAPLPSLCPPTR